MFRFSAEFEVRQEDIEERLARLDGFSRRRNRKPDTPVAPVRILLADDSSDNHFLIKAFLAKSHYVLDLAENGEIATQKYMANDYDIVLMDVQMPVMDGLAATAKIRAWERDTARPCTPILALTAHALVEDSQKSFDAGCTGHLTKPITKARLLEALASAAPAARLAEIRATT